MTEDDRPEEILAGIAGLIVVVRSRIHGTDEEAIAWLLGAIVVVAKTLRVSEESVRKAIEKALRSVYVSGQN